jgi:membrane-bound metal-dependent hydrolase YbcI (DUF457 family)
VDLFSHVLVAYLVVFGTVGPYPQYLAAGALAGGLPDADALFFPIAHRFPILRHHGITHSLFGVTVIAVAGALIAPLLLPGSPWIYFLVMELGGVCHILQDAFTNFAIPPLLPFSQRQVSVDADRAINFITLIVSIVALYVLLGLERNQVPIVVYYATVYGLMAVFAFYFALRLSLRYYLGRKVRTLGEYTHVVPTGNPFVWILISERKEPGHLRTVLGRYRFGSGVDGPYVLDVPVRPLPTPTTPITSAAEALERSYPYVLGHGRFFDDSYHFGEATPTATGGWEATWYSVEFGAFGRWPAVAVSFPAEGGAPVVRRGFQRVAMPWARPNPTGSS